MTTGAFTTACSLVAMLVVGAASPACGASNCTTDGRYVMGTILQVELCSIDPAAQRAALDATFTAARHIDEMLTTYAADGPTSRFNAHAGQGAQALPPEVVEVLASARSHHILTAGTFDVTVGPLLALWRVAGANGRIPAPQEVAAARARVGSERILLGSDGRSAALPDEGMAVDFGGVGKGYALDRLVARLRASGLDRALLDFGRSSVWALGQPPDAPAWRLLLEHPSRGAIGVISLRDEAMSVSGSLAQSTEIGGRRYGHVVDPRSGWPLERDLLAVVVAPSAELAEALSKALLILGEQEGIALLERVPGVQGTLVEAGGRSWSSRGWDRIFAARDLPRD